MIDSVLFFPFFLLHTENMSSHQQRDACHPLEEKWHLELDEVIRWTRDLRVLRLEARDKIQRFMEGVKDDRAFDVMRAEVCDIIVKHLAPILEDYWSHKKRSQSPKSEELDFFFSPGYRPYGGDRRALPPPASAETKDEIASGQLGRHSRRNAKTVFFPLAAWMATIYSVRLKVCKIGGFTDWFGKYYRVYCKADDAPLIALSITNRHDGATEPSDSVLRLRTFGDSPELRLNQFTSVLESAQEHLVFKEYGEDGIKVAVNVVPYPPAYVFRNSRDGKRPRFPEDHDATAIKDPDVEAIEVDQETLVPMKPPHWSVVPEELNDTEKKEIDLSKRLFAYLFTSIFDPTFTVPKDIHTDDSVIRVMATMASAASKTSVAYPFYHVMICDQDIAPPRVGDHAKQVLTGKLGTLNLYTPYPICDLGLGLLRDSLEAVYDSVRDAEILTYAFRAKYHADDRISNILKCILLAYDDNYEPLVDRSGAVWTHDALEKATDFYWNLAKEAFPALENDKIFDGDRSSWLKTLFEIE